MQQNMIGLTNDLSRKIAKFIFKKDIEWPCKLQTACLSANNHRKRATNYTPLKLMCGREYIHLPILSQMNLPNEEHLEEEIIDDINEDESSKLEVPTNWIADIENIRNVQRNDAITNIRIEQSELSEERKSKRGTTPKCDKNKIATEILHLLICILISRALRSRD